MKLKIITLTILFLFCFTTVILAMDGFDALIKLERLEYEKKQRGQEQIRDASKRFKKWGESRKIERIEKALLKLDEWNMKNIAEVMKEYNASLEEINQALANITTLRKHIKTTKE